MLFKIKIKLLADCVETSNNFVEDFWLKVLKKSNSTVSSLLTEEDIKILKYLIDIKFEIITSGTDIECKLL